MGTKTNRSRGFTLIASLLLLVLLSAVAAGLIYSVTGAGHAGGNDMEANTAYYAAQAGMEKLTSDVLSLYQQKLSPSSTDLTNLASTSPPSSALIPGVTFYESASWTNSAGNGTSGTPNPGTNVVSAGAYAGLTAEVIPMTLQVTAVRGSGAAANITRGVEIALIPVFQFGVFSDSDLSYFAGPVFPFLGRVHTNGNLYLTSNPGPTVIGDKITVVGQILRDRLPNDFAVTCCGGTGGVGAGGTTYDGNVYLATGAHDCDAFAAVLASTGTDASTPATGSGCVNIGPDVSLATDDSSWSGGIPGATGSYGPGSANSHWNGGTGTGIPIDTAYLNSYAMTGTPLLQMPFVQGTTQGSSGNYADTQIEIIRKPESVSESPTSPLGASREINKANIRILLGDTEAELHPTGSANDSSDVQLDSSANQYPNGFTVANTTGTSYLAVADPGSNSGPDPNLTLAKPRCGPGGTAAAPVYPTAHSSEASCSDSQSTWPLVRGWLRVEYLNSSNQWIGITTEWLKFGFARGLLPPTKSIGSGVGTITSYGIGSNGTNPIHPNAILIFQQLADRNGDGEMQDVVGGHPDTNVMAKTGSTNMGYENSSPTGSQYNWYPINLFDAREGLARDLGPSTTPTSPLSGNSTCYANGIMNVVELDVGNLAQWMAGSGKYSTGSGSKVNSSPQNGYLVYFSDRRGEDTSPTNGESGIEDVINSGSSYGTPDGHLETTTAGFNGNNGYSPEDVDENGVLDNWGEVNIGDGFGLNTDTSTPNPFVSLDCANGGRQAWVSGARHALGLVDGTLGNLPQPGFTVASENPVYVFGDYNSNSTDTVWNTTPVDESTMSAAAIIADAVTLLSNSWSDLTSMQNANNIAGRLPSLSSYRMAIAAGKNMNFPNATYPGGNYPQQDFGTDGGIHNFLRFLERWNSPQIQLNYRGSLVSMYYAEYATGTFKDGPSVYGPPKRNFSFDQDFLTPTKLPPGTPMLQDIDTLSYWQSFTPCTTQSGGTCTN